MQQRLLARFSDELKKKSTPSELIFKNKLIELGLKFKEQKGVFNYETFYIADFFLPKPYKLWIEIDGAYHNVPQQKKYDKQKECYLIKDRKFRILRLTNEKAESIPIDDLKKLLSSYLR